MSGQISKFNSKPEPTLEMVDRNLYEYVDLSDSISTHIVGGAYLNTMSTDRQAERRPNVPGIIITLTDGRNNKG